MNQSKYSKAHQASSTKKWHFKHTAPGVGMNKHRFTALITGMIAFFDPVSSLFHKQLIDGFKAVALIFPGGQ